MRVTISALLILSAALPASAQSFTSVDEALDAMKNRQPYRSKLTKELAIEATRRVVDSEDLAEVRNLMKLAKVGRVEVELAQALMQRAEADPSDLASYRFLLKVRPEKVLAAAGRTSQWIPVLLDALDMGEEAGDVQREPLILLARHARPHQALELVSRWADSEPVPAYCATFLGELARNAYPKELLEPLCTLNLKGVGQLETLQANAIRSMVSRDLEVASEALAMLEAGRGDRMLLLNCLGAVPQKLRDRARKVILKSLKTDFDSDLRAAVVAAGLLKATEGLPRILELAEQGSGETQVAALRVLPKLVVQLYAADDADADTKVKNEEELLAKNAELKRRCTEIVKSVLLDGEGAALAAAIAAGKRLGLKDALPPGVIRQLATSKDLGAEARSAAIYAIPFTCLYNAANVDLLLDLMKDPAVKVAAHVTLKQFARVRIPLRLDQWRAWRQRQALDQSEDRSDPKYYQPPVGWTKGSESRGD